MKSRAMFVGNRARCKVLDLTDVIEELCYKQEYDAKSSKEQNKQFQDEM